MPGAARTAHQHTDSSFAVTDTSSHVSDVLRALSLTQPAGLLIVTPRLEPMFMNRAAAQILGYPDQTATNAARMQERLRVLLGTSELTPTQSVRLVFLSGRRLYTCQSLPMEPHAGDRDAPAIALLLERGRRDPVAVSEISRRFRLSSRESETVRHLIDGRTTKEVAARMGVSPNTVKQFVRLAMSKMGVSSRSAIVGKVLTN